MCRCCYINSSMQMMLCTHVLLHASGTYLPPLTLLPMQMWELYVGSCLLDKRGLQLGSGVRGGGRRGGIVLRAAGIGGGGGDDSSGGGGGEKNAWRPLFPDEAPAQYVRLARQCWDANPFVRCAWTERMIVGWSDCLFSGIISSPHGHAWKLCRQRVHA